MTSILGPLGVASSRAVGGPCAAAGQDAGFAGLVAEIQLAEAPVDVVKEPAVATDPGPPYAEPAGVEEMLEPVASDLVPVQSTAVQMVPLTGQAAEATPPAPDAAEDGLSGELATMPKIPPNNLAAGDDASSPAPDLLPEGPTDAEMVAPLEAEPWTTVAPATLAPDTGANPLPNSDRPHPAGPSAPGQVASSRPDQLLPVPAAAPVGDDAAPPPAIATSPEGTAVAGPAVATGLGEAPGADKLLRRATGFGVRVERVGPGKEAVSAANPGRLQDTIDGSADAGAAPVLPATAEPDEAVHSMPRPPAEGAERAATATTVATGPEAQAPEFRTEMLSPASQVSAAPQALPATPAMPTPRSPLVQAALDRVLPLPAVAGETVVRLNPQGLGLIEVVVQESRDGTLDVTLRVQNPLVLEALRHDRDAVAQAVSSAQGGTAGSLSMDLFHSGSGQRGAEPEANRFRPAATGQEPADDLTDEPNLQILSADRVNIVT